MLGGAKLPGSFVFNNPLQSNPLEPFFQALPRRALLLAGAQYSLSLSLYIYIYIYIHTYIYTHTYTYTHTYSQCSVHIYIYIYTQSINIYIYIYIYIDRYLSKYGEQCFCSRHLAMIAITDPCLLSTVLHFQCFRVWFIFRVWSDGQ